MNYPSNMFNRQPSTMNSNFIGLQNSLNIINPLQQQHHQQQYLMNNAFLLSNSSTPLRNAPLPTFPASLNSSNNNNNLLSLIRNNNNNIIPNRAFPINEKEGAETLLNLRNNANTSDMTPIKINMSREVSPINFQSYVQSGNEIMNHSSTINNGMIIMEQIKRNMMNLSRMISHDTINNSNNTMLVPSNVQSDRECDQFDLMNRIQSPKDMVKSNSMFQNVNENQSMSPKTYAQTAQVEQIKSPNSIRPSVPPMELSNASSTTSPDSSESRNETDNIEHVTDSSSSIKRSREESIDDSTLYASSQGESKAKKARKINDVSIRQKEIADQNSNESESEEDDEKESTVTATTTSVSATKFVTKTASKKPPPPGEFLIQFNGLPKEYISGVKRVSKSEVKHWVSIPTQIEKAGKRSASLPDSLKWRAWVEITAELPLNNGGPLRRVLDVALYFLRKFNANSKVLADITEALGPAYYKSNAVGTCRRRLFEILREDSQMRAAAQKQKQLV